MQIPPESPRHVIWKFPIQPNFGNKYQSIYMPIGAKILTVQMQYEHGVSVEDGKPFIWAEVDPEEEGQDHRQFHIAGTGYGLSKNPRTYIGTWQDRWTVWHLFELLREAP